MADMNDAPPKYEFSRAIVALLRLMQLDLNAVELFGKTPQDAWRAVRFVLYAAPLVMLLGWWSAAEFVRITGHSEFSFSALMAVRMLVVAFGFPLVVHQLGLRLGYNKYFAHYLTAQFTLTLPMTIIIVGLSGLGQILGFNEQSSYLFAVLVYSIQIFIDWAVTYSTLRIKPGVAFGLCIMGVLFNMLVQMGMMLAVLITSTEILQQAAAQ